LKREGREKREEKEGREGGRGEVRMAVENVSNSLWWRLDGQARGLGSGGKGVENIPQNRRFLPTFS